MKRISIVGIYLLVNLTAFAQSNVSTKYWHWKDYEKDTVHGISLYQAYQVLANSGLQPNPVTVAVMDGGVDTTHVALKNRLWINKKEIAHNGIDDDKNGYIDDIHGWNFLGGRDGRNIDKASDEKSRIYHQFKSRFELPNVDTSKMNPTQKRQYAIWKQTEKEIEFSEEEAANLAFIKMTSKALKKMGNTILKEIKDSNFTAFQLETFQPIGTIALEAKLAYLRTIQIIGIDKDSPYHEVISDLTEYIEGKEKAAQSKSTPPSPIREEIIKDNYQNFADRFYGNNDITGPNARHGTHVAGLVASIPDSSWNINEWYPNINIMGVRVVPDGDEYDKDVALGIRYAVDNGAKIINMSFGKSYSPEQIWVDSAIRYAASKDVLIVHAAGNEYYDLNVKPVYPNPYSSLLRDTAKNVITIGASSDFFINESLLTDFSNFGSTIVDVLSPGNKIYSTLPGTNNYGYLQGTSMAAPIVSHIAAMIRSYYPKLSAIEVKKIIMQSVWKPNEIDEEFEVPSKDETKSLSQVAASGGIVNAAKAIQIAGIYDLQKATKKSKSK